MSHKQSANIVTVRAMMKKLVRLPRRFKKLILMSMDELVSLSCISLALYLRYGYLSWDMSIWQLLGFAVTPVFVLYILGFYSSVSRSFTEQNLRLPMVVVFALIMCAELYIATIGLSVLPRSVPFIYGFLFLFWLWLSRLSLKGLLFIYQNENVDRVSRKKAIIVGADEQGQALFTALYGSNDYFVHAFVDDDTSLVGGNVFDLKIYTYADLTYLVKQNHIDHILIAKENVPNTVIKQWAQSLVDVPVTFKTLPNMQHIVSGKIEVNLLKNVDVIEILNRPTAEPIESLMTKNIFKKNILVTGAGGSIGSEICRQVVKQGPLKLVLFDLSEYALYSIQQELLQSNRCLKNGVEIVGVLGSVMHESLLQNVMAEHAIDTVYHAAAYKHVPIVEQCPFEGTINNAVGTYRCALAALNNNVETFVLISTDKAVRPTNIMGASKRIAELVCQALADKSQSTCFSMVRFGNVLGSSGSVVPVFKKQIAEGGPITVTHPDITRYFMTIPEASQLVIQAGAMAKGGEVFVLDMGQPVKIVDLAKQMIHLSGLSVKDEGNPDGDIAIEFTGLRPGEKLYEELIIGGDNVFKTSHPLIMCAIENKFDLETIENLLNQLMDNALIGQDVMWLKGQFEFFVESYKCTS